MKIMCPYIPGQLNEETRDALFKYAPGTEFVNVEGDMHAYWKELKKRWDGTEDLLVVEQDIVIREGFVERFAKCQQWWCTYGYLYTRGNDARGYEEILCYNAMGCVRFSAALQKRHPLAVAYSPEVEDHVNIPWFLVDFSVAQILMREHAHCHGLVEHHQIKRDWEAIGAETGFTKLLSE